MKRRGFTIVELLLAVALLAVLLVTSGAVFKMAVKTHVTAAATAEISRKLRGITDQLDADFRGLRKDAEIFIVWVPSPVDKAGNPDDGAPTWQFDHYGRFDRMIFFADGDFQSYSEQIATGAPVTGNMARIEYMLANNGSGQQAQAQAALKRVLARSQHIFTADPLLVDDPVNPARRRAVWIDPTNINVTFTPANDNLYEYDNLNLKEWLNIQWADKQEMLTRATGITVGTSVSPVNGSGLKVDTNQPLNVHELMAQGVGEFSVQSWYPAQGRWFPEVDPDRNGDLTDTDFNLNGGVLDSVNVPGLLYPYVAYLAALDPADMHGVIVSPNVIYPRTLVDEEHFDQIPGLGRALKFTFTLYDSRGVFKEGKKFTHIVYLDD
jgi:prepilin-type N-terminal cleavage/methylation domain-containing protein